MNQDLYDKLAEPIKPWSTSRYECPVSRCDWTYDAPNGYAPMFRDLATGSLKTHSSDINGIIREHCETHSAEDWVRELENMKGRLEEMAALAERTGADAVPAMLALPCTGCVIDAKQAVARGAEVPEPLPGSVLINGMLICDVRHTLNVGTPQLLIAQPGQMPTGGLVG